MAPNPKRQEQFSDDIDLLALAARSLAFVKKYRWLFLIAGIIGISLGVWKTSTLPTKYKSSLLVRPVILTNQEEIQIVSNWNELLKKKEYGALSKTFNCDEEIVRNLFEIKAEEIQKVFTPTNPNAFTIDVLVKTNDVLPALQQGILYGFENSGYVPQKLAAKKARITELIQKTESDILQLDSTKKTMTSILRGNSNSSSSLIMDGSSINRLWIEMNEKLLNLQEELKFTNAVQLLQGFQPFRNPVRQSGIVYVAIGLLACLSLAYLFAIVRELNQKLKIRQASST